MKYLTPIIVSILFINCNNPSSKSLMTELTPEEINTLSKKDTLFNDFYKMIEELRSSELSTNSEKSKYIDITYDDFLEMNQLTNDSSYWENIYETKKQIWYEKYGTIENQIDSVIDYYTNRYEENRLDQYVDIQFFDIKKKYFPNSTEVMEVSFGFKITPLVEKIDFIQYQFSFTPKEKDKKSEVLDLERHLGDFNQSSIYTPFSKPIIDYYDFKLYLIGTLEYEDKTHFLSVNDLKIKVESIWLNNQRFNSSDYELPHEIKYFHERSGILKDFYKKRIAEEFLNKTFVPLSTYNTRIQDSILKINESYGKIFDLYNIYNKRYRKQINEDFQIVPAN